MGVGTDNGPGRAHEPGRVGGAEDEPSAAPSRKRAILELAPLELACMNALWPLGEATVREIRDRLAAHRPRAYTTIMTIMDRLAHKGVVSRKKVGRAYSYVPNLTLEQARSRAVSQVVEGFFDGSIDALSEHLGMPASTANRAPALEVAGESPADSAAAPIDESLL